MCLVTAVNKLTYSTCRCGHGCEGAIYWWRICSRRCNSCIFRNASRSMQLILNSILLSKLVHSICPQHQGTITNMHSIYAIVVSQMTCSMWQHNLKVLSGFGSVSINEMIWPFYGASLWSALYNLTDKNADTIHRKVRMVHVRLRIYTECSTVAFQIISNLTPHACSSHASALHYVVYSNVTNGLGTVVY